MYKLALLLVLAGCGKFEIEHTGNVTVSVDLVAIFETCKELMPDATEAELQECVQSFAEIVKQGASQ